MLLMFQKLFCWITALALLIPCLPAVAAGDAQSIRASVEAAYDGYAASIYQKNAADDAMDQLLKQGFYGKGKPLSLGPKDPFTSALFQTVLFREGLTDILVQALTQMSGAGMERMTLSATFSWHNFRTCYNAYQCRDDESYDTEKKALMGQVCPTTDVDVSSSKADTTMLLVVGGAQCFLRITRTECTGQSITYRVSLLTHDNFSFEGNYDAADRAGYNTTFSKLLCVLGPLMGLRQFDWTCQTAFDVTIDNSCDHTLRQGRWVMEDGTLVSDPAQGAIAVTQLEALTDEGAHKGYYYHLAQPLRLLHDQAWAVEFRMKGSGNFYLPFNAQGSSPGFSLFRYSTFMCANRTKYTETTDPNTGEAVRTAYADRAGIEYDSQYLKDMHTYRVENRIAEDGTNMPWLLIDGQEQGPLTSHWTRVNKPQTGSYEYVYDAEPTYDLCGQDMIINYIFSTGSPMSRPDTFQWVAVWESTDPDGTLLDSGSRQATCVEPGSHYTVCSVCGAREEVEQLPALGHQVQTVPGKAANCTDTGLTEGSFCALCAQTLTEQTPIPALGHASQPLDGCAATCSQPGLTEGAKCRTCGEILLAQKELPALGHAFEQGRCSRCGEADPHWLPGDADGDGTLTYQDARIVLMHSVGIGECDTVLCDMDGNGLLDYLDAMVILRKAVGL